MDSRRDLFSDQMHPDTFRRVDSTHPLDLYAGRDEMFRCTLLLLCNIRPENVSSSRMIYAQVGKRKDGRWAVSLALINEDYREMFLLFCQDIIESSRAIKNKDRGARFFISRYNEWKKMLANSSRGILSPAEIKGLLGEMYVLYTVLIPVYGAEKAVLSWTGPRAGHQDFVMDHTWYEVKTISSSREEIRVSSLEQLDCATNGKLIVVSADKTSSTNKSAVNLNILYNRILDSIRDEDIIVRFSGVLFDYGYYSRPEYEDDDACYMITGIRSYKVTKEFPSLRKNNVPFSVVKAEYWLSLPAIKDYRED